MTELTEINRGKLKMADHPKNTSKGGAPVQSPSDLGHAMGGKGGSRPSGGTMSPTDLDKANTTSGGTKKGK